MAADPLETAWKLHSAISDWTGKADVKASFALTLQSTILAVLGVLAGSSQGTKGLGSGAARPLLWMGVVFLACGACCAAAAISPNLRKERRSLEAGEDFLFFGHVRTWEPANLESALREKDPLPALSRQLVVMSEIAWTKHRRVQWSLLLAVPGVVALSLAAALR
ncbi:Pycsar system effector family protein [Streptomyces sp. NPDC059982]|uniref:Pycsar system effector family protein n=1 Tax=unclassified Streptomyces TaxID=2593676 RepID=UPI0036B0CB35